MSTYRQHQERHDGQIPLRRLAFFRNRFREHIFDLVLTEFKKQAQRGFSKRDLARRINRGPEQITRWLAAPSNLTLDTVSDLLLAISEAEPTVSLRRLNRLD